MTQKTRTTNNQDVESRRQLRSRIAQGFNVQEHASALRSAAALLDSDFEHPGEKKAVSKVVEEYLARYREKSLRDQFLKVL
ncbi:MAG: hypothetical protein WCH20_07395 [Nitrospira sp.]